MYLKDKLDITDPCYDKDVWCRITVPCLEGEYTCHYDTVEIEDWGKRVKSIWIKHEDFQNADDWEFVGTIGVDAGLAGFFDDKPDFDDKEWEELCDEIFDKNVIETKFEGRDAFFTQSGIGDGVYDVYVIRKEEDVVAAKIIFICEEDLC